MKLIKFEMSHRIEMAPVSGRFVELVAPVCLSYHTNEGVHRFDIDNGFMWDGRSGGPAGDLILPNHGTQEQSALALGHDAGGYPDTVSADLDNELYCKGLESIGTGDRIIYAVRMAIEITSHEWKAYGWSEVDEQYQLNRGKIKYTWSSK